MMKSMINCILRTWVKIKFIVSSQRRTARRDLTAPRYWENQGPSWDSSPKPAGFVTDDLGSMIVVDSANNRHQIVDEDWNFLGIIKVTIIHYQMT